MKTLVIHPYDLTTRMLDVYEDKDWTVITDPHTSKKTIKEEIKAHDRIIMLGHGTKDGLIAKLGGYNHRFIIDSSLVYLLREKEIIAIWCEADQFVEKYDLKGFYTGMIISEYEEALYVGVFDFTDKDINLSNVLFGEAVEKSIDKKDMLKSMISEYKGSGNPIIEYNMSRLYSR